MKYPMKFKSKNNSMEHSKLIWSLIVIWLIGHFGLVDAHNSLPYPNDILYFGDISLWSYLTDWCTRIETDNQKNVIFGDLGAIDDTPIIKHLRKLDCPYMAYNLSVISSENLTQIFRHSLSHELLLVLFDFTTSDKSPINQTEFEWALLEQSHAYTKSNNCFPFISLFDLSTNQLELWANELYPKLNPDFRTVLVSNQLPVSDGGELAEWGQTVQIRPFYDGCHQYDGIMVPNSNEMFRRLKIPFYHCNLNSTTLTATVSHYLPACHITNSSDGKVKFGFSVEGEMLQILMDHFNFKVNLIEENHYGMKVNGVWTGAIGRVYNRNTDFAMCSVSFKEDRSKVVDYIIAHDGELTFMSAFPKQVLRDTIALDPFQREVWFALFGTFVLMAIWIKWMARLTTTKMDNQCQIKFNSIIFKLYSIIMGQPPIFQNYEKNFIRIFYIGWILASLVLSHSYRGCFYSILAVPDTEDPIDTVEQLLEIAKTDSQYIVTLSNSSYMASFVHPQLEDPSWFSVIGEHINRTNQKHITSGNDLAELFRPDKPKRSIFIGKRLRMAFYRRARSTVPLYIASEKLKMELSGIVFVKKSPLFYPFFNMVNRIMQHGMMDKWTRQLTYRLPAINPGAPFIGNPEIVPEIDALKMFELKSIFYILLAGLSISFGVLIVEIGSQSIHRLIKPAKLDNSLRLTECARC